MRCEHPECRWRTSRAGRPCRPAASLPTRTRTPGHRAPRRAPDVPVRTTSTRTPTSPGPAPHPMRPPAAPSTGRTSHPRAVRQVRQRQVHRGPRAGAVPPDRWPGRYLARSTPATGSPTLPCARRPASAGWRWGAADFVLVPTRTNGQPASGSTCVRRASGDKPRGSSSGTDRRPHQRLDPIREHRDPTVRATATVAPYIGGRVLSHGERSASGQGPTSPRTPR